MTTDYSLFYQFFISLPDKYDSRIGEGGINLSEGQKQRLCIARALIKDPDILIFDEPTSALDRDTEKAILKSLPEMVQKKTMLVVSHSLPVIMDCSRVFLLKDNCITVINTDEYSLLTGLTSAHSVK